MAAGGDAKKHALAVQAVQSLLKIDFPTLVVDGWWGPRSAAALARASGPVKSLAENAKTFSDSIKVPEENTSSGRWVARAEALRLIENAAVNANIPKEWLEFMLDLEPTKRWSPAGVEYKVDSTSPGNSYFGLMQIGRKAWSDARQLFPFIGDFERNKFDPALNIMAAAGYARKNMEYARSIHGYDGPFSAELIYSLHNQGHTFLSSVKKGGSGRWYDGQSEEAKRVLAATSRDLRSRNLV